MIFSAVGLQASSSDTTKALYVLRFRALRIDYREQFYGFKHASAQQNPFNMLNSKNVENGIRIAFSCLQDAPKTKPWTLELRAQIQPRAFENGQRPASHCKNAYETLVLDEQVTITP